MTEAWRFRNGTLDKAIFNGVVVFNEYRLPDSFAPGDIVIDVGANIGAFAQAVLSRGYEKAYCLEPDRVSFDAAPENRRPLSKKGHFRLFMAAPSRSYP